MPTRRQFLAAICVTSICPSGSLAARNVRQDGSPILAATLDDATRAFAVLDAHIRNGHGPSWTKDAVDRTRAGLVALVLRLGQLYTGRSDKVSTLDDYRTLWRVTSGGASHALERLRLTDAWAAIQLCLSSILSDMTGLLAAIEADRPGAVRGPGYLSLQRAMHGKSGPFPTVTASPAPLTETQIGEFDRTIEAYHRLRNILYDCIAGLNVIEGASST